MFREAITFLGYAGVIITMLITYGAVTHVPIPAEEMQAWADSRGN